MEKFVIDTNFFVNLEIKSGFGNNPKEVIGGFTNLANRLKKENKSEFFMPPRILDEFFGFFENYPAIKKDFSNTITIKSPDVFNLQFPAGVFYQLVDEIRKRTYRGLRIAEEAVEDGARKTTGKKLNKIEFEKTIGSTIKNLRERHRNATRVNFLDSVADLDLIVLTKQIDGFLISSDEGVLRWGRVFGVKEVPPRLFRERLLSLLA
jgi:RNA ligase partner protein